NEIMSIVVWRRSQLCGRIVTMIEQIVDLHENLRTRLHLVMRSKIQDSIPGRKSLSEVVDAIGLIQIIFVASRKGSPDRIEVQIHRDFRGGLILDERLENMPGNLRNAVAGLYSNVAIQSQTSIIGAITAAVKRLGTLIRRVQKGVIAADAEMPDLATDVDLHSLASSLAKVGEIA